MIQLQQQLGQPVDTAALAEIMEATRPHRELLDALPEWYVVAECMRAYHWTERQFWEDNSPAMIIRILWLEGVYAEKQEKDSPSRKGNFDGPANNQGQLGHPGMERVGRQNTPTRH